MAGASGPESGGVGLDARFTFTIPVAEASGGGPAPGRPGAPGEAPAAVPILVVDDDPETLRHVRDTLAEAGYAPLVTGDPRELPRIIRAEKPRLVLLDLMLPGTDGIELMQTVPELADLPVIFISGYGRDETIARALEAGAEDYVVKPFSPTELTARIRAALRRRSNPAPFVLGELAIDHDRRRVSVAGRPVTLTATEYELLRVLAQGAGRVLTHQALLRQVWAGRELPATPRSCAPTSSGCATSSATTPPARPGYSTSAGSATACPGPARPSGPRPTERQDAASASSMRFRRVQTRASEKMEPRKRLCDIRNCLRGFPRH